MYVDTKETAFIQDLRQPSLLALSYILRHREHWPAGFKWDFTYCQSCAIGLASELWNARPHDALPDSIRSGIFCEASTKRIPFLWFFERAPRTHNEVTPEMVADQIDNYLAVRTGRSLRCEK